MVTDGGEASQATAVTLPSVWTSSLPRAVGALALLALGLGLPARLVGVVLRPRHGSRAAQIDVQADPHHRLAGLVGKLCRLVDQD